MLMGDIQNHPEQDHKIISTTRTEQAGGLRLGERSHHLFQHPALRLSQQDFVSI
jgi:hypothetical protein